MKPCQMPSQKPASTLCSFTVPLNWFGPGAQPTSIFTSRRATTRNTKEDFIAIPSLRIYEELREKDSLNLFSSRRVYYELVGTCWYRAQERGFQRSLDSEAEERFLHRNDRWRGGWRGLNPSPGLRSG